MDENGNPWWVAKDVCDILGLDQTHKALGRLKENQRGGIIIPSLGGPQKALTVSEFGLYKLIFKSRKPEAERLRKE